MSRWMCMGCCRVIDTDSEEYDFEKEVCGDCAEDEEE